MSFRLRLPRALPADRMLRDRLTPRQVAGRVVAIFGAILFAAGFIGNASGAFALPYDQHHVFAQIGGLAAVVTGLNMTSKRH